AGENAKFQLPFINLALVQEAGASLLLPRRAGHALAAELLMLGEPFDAAKALRAGLISEIVADDQALPRAIDMARRLAAKPAAALQEVKRLMRAPDADALKRVMDAELACFQQRLASPEAKESFTAFLEKRMPDFSKFA
ncbi:enoyl-CoA hydratase, partial [bacterium]|nr:enoyl-CoA hydratase [bacterium]